MQSKEEDKLEQTNEIKEKQKSKFDFSFLAEGYYPYIIFTILIAVVFGEVITYGFSGLDDHQIIIEHWDIISNLTNIKEAFLRDAFLSGDFMKDKMIGFYRPMQTISYMIDAQIGGKSPWIYHFTNLLIHLLTTFSVYKLLQKFSEDKIIALFLGCLFSILPIFTHAIAWVPSRGDLLIGFFGVLSVLLLIKYNETKKGYFLVMHMLSFLFAMFSKESAVCFIPIYLYYLILIIQKRKIKDYISYSLLWCLIILIYYYFRIYAEMLSPDLSQNIIIVFWYNIPVVLEYISKMIIPFNLSVMPKYSLNSILIGGVLTLGIIMIILISKENRKMIVWAILWFFILLIPVLLHNNDNKEISYDYLEHRAYLPLVGILFLLSTFFNQLLKSIKPVIIYAFLIISICAYSTISFSYKENFRDEVSFNGSVLEKNLNNVVALTNLGNFYFLKSSYKDSEKYYQIALKSDPNSLTALYNMGLILNIKKDPIGALNMFDKILSINPDYPNLYKLLGSLLYQIGDFKLAVIALTKATVIYPKDAENFNLLGNSYNTLREYGKAETALLRSIQLDPNNSIAFTNLGVTYYQTGNYQKAISNFKKAIELDPKNAIALKDIAFAYGRINDGKKQIEYFKIAAKLGSGVAINWLKGNNISW
jgi:tetratricopeptide (TPR) repeat protein